MRMIRRALCALLLGPASAAYADFSWELAGLLGQAERSGVNQGFRTEFDSDQVALSGTYYFDRVEDGNGPHALATFLDPATHLTVAANEERATSRLSDPFAPVSQIDTETNEYSLSGVYLLSESRWYAGGRYSSRDLGDPEFSPPLPPSPVASSIDSESYGVVAGKYFGSGATRLELSLDRSKFEVESSVTFCGPTCLVIATSTETKTDTTGLDVMHVRRFRAATYALHGGIREIQAKATAQGATLPPVTIEPDSVHAYSVGAELYPVPAIGVRLGYTRTDGPVADTEDTSVGASWFFRPNVGLELTLSRLDPDVLPRTERAALAVIGRF